MIIIAGVTIFVLSIFYLEYSVGSILGPVAIILAFFLGGIFPMLKARKNAVEKGRKLYKAHKEEFDPERGLDLRNIDMRTANLSWSITHINWLLSGIIICVIIVILLFIFGTLLFPIFEIVFISTIFIVIAMFFLNFYKPAKKFQTLMVNLKEEIKEVNSVNEGGLRSLRFNTYNYGEFFVFWNRGGGFSKGLYYIWIQTSKSIPTTDRMGMSIWERYPPSKMWKDEYGDGFPELLSPSQAKDIASLKELRFEIGEERGRIEGILEDKFFKFEVSDVLKTVTLLREIERKL
jgi:hypothetical protein